MVRRRGLGVALGPVVGGAIVEGISWHWIFWLNVPIGLALVPFSLRVLSESHGPTAHLDLRGVALAGSGLFGARVRDRPRPTSSAGRAPTMLAR